MFALCFGVWLILNMPAPSIDNGQFFAVAEIGISELGRTHVIPMIVPLAGKGMQRKYT
jgi:hypothetical protein